MREKRVLIIYYSFTQQTRLLVKRFAEGLESTGVRVSLERLVPCAPYTFPFRRSVGLAVAMMLTFLRKRDPVQALPAECYGTWDLIILAGPTWSYHPSGPVLGLLDEFGQQLFDGNRVLPLISCRSYWRIHLWSLTRILKRCGAELEKPLVFTHPGREPWRFIGLIFQLRGKVGKKEQAWLRRRYPGFGHSLQQKEKARQLGKTLGHQLKAESAGDLV